MLSLKKLTCHCGAVEIQVNLNDNIDKLKRCNCSMCKRKGTMVATIEKKDLKVIKGEKIKLKFINSILKLLSIIFAQNVEFKHIIKEEVILILMV